MAHRKVRSLGNVPFSWEELPGVPKQSIQIEEKKIYEFTAGSKISLPPPLSGRSLSLKKIMWGPQDPDPFAKAIKKCTENHRSSNEEGIMCFGSNLLIKHKMISLLRCKKSNDVKEGNLVKLKAQQQQLQLHGRHLTSCPRQRKLVGATNVEIGSDSHDPRAWIKVYFNNFTLVDH